jgi:6-phosphogluconolactonase/glucosamine-6-phosphate isomerase/deaminase
MKRTYTKNNFNIMEVNDVDEGSKAAFELLRRLIDSKTLLFLSGGSTPKQLYEMIALDTKKQIIPGAVATIDERWGPPGHKDSNEEMIKKTGIYSYFKDLNVEIHTILHGILNKSETAKRYATVVEGLLERFRKQVSIMGIGADGHTAGIAPNAGDMNGRLAKDYKYDNPGWNFPERITLTAKALEKINTHVILVFGEEKQEALSKLTHPKTNQQKYPAAILRSTKKNYLITNQQVP